jgi:hypothetical protein
VTKPGNSPNCLSSSVITSQKCGAVSQHHLLGLAVGQPPCSGNGVEMQVGGDGPHSRPYSESKAGPKEGPWFLRVDHGSECAGVDSHLSGSP